MILMKDGELNTRNYLAIARTIVQGAKGERGRGIIYFLPSLPLVEKKKKETKKQKNPPQC